MATFDGSTPPAGVAVDDSGGPAHARPPSPSPLPPLVDETPDSLLDQLKVRVDERDDTEPQEWFKEIPKVGLRLVCDTDFPHDLFQRWMKAARPRNKGRRAGQANALDLDQLALSARALAEQCVRIEIRRGDAWVPMRGRNGEELDLRSDELLRTFSVMDALSLLRKLFGRDAKVIDAGTELLAEAGYGDDEDDPE